MESSVDVVWLVRELWKRRIPMLVVFLCVLLGGEVAPFARRPEYRAVSQIMLTDPAGFLKSSKEMRRELGLIQLRREALAEHAASLSDPGWAEKVIATELGADIAERIAPSVRGVVVEGNASNAITLSLSVTAGAPGLAADAANALADAYVACASGWPKAQLKSALAALQARRSQLESESSEYKAHLLQFDLDSPTEQNSARMLARAIDLLAVESLHWKARTEADYSQEQIAVAIRPYIASADEAMAIAAGIANSKLPAELELKLRSAERMRAAQSLASVTHHGGGYQPVEPEDGEDAQLEVPERALEAALFEHLACLTDAPIQLEEKTSAVSRLWLTARTANVRAEAYQEIRARLLEQHLQEMLRYNHVGALNRRIEALMADLRRIVDTETSFAAELAGEGAPAALVVYQRAVPPSRSLAMPLVKSFAFAFATAFLAALAFGLALQTFAPSQNQQAARPGPPEGSAGDRPAA